MRRIRTIVLLETLLIAFTISSVQAIPVQAPGGEPGHLAVDVSVAASEGTWTWADRLQMSQVFWIDEPGGSTPGGVNPDWGLGPSDNDAVGNFLLAPEPGTFLLFGAALAGAGLAGRHQRRRARAPGRTEP
jgi:hypothetical protein